MNDSLSQTFTTCSKTSLRMQSKALVYVLHCQDAAAYERYIYNEYVYLYPSFVYISA